MPASHQSNSSRRCPDARSLHADEAYVLDAYQLHAQCCSRCADPLDSTNLCPQGTLLAECVVKYLFRREGQFYARRNHPGDKTDKVRLTPNAYSVRWLLAAVEQGRHLNTTEEEESGTATPDHPSIRIIEPKPRQSTSTYYIRLRPFCSRKNHFYVQRPSHSEPSSAGQSALMVGITCKSRRSTVAVELKFYPNT